VLQAGNRGAQPLAIHKHDRSRRVIIHLGMRQVTPITSDRIAGNAKISLSDYGKARVRTS
jgi:hypothetical protein